MALPPSRFLVLGLLGAVAACGGSSTAVRTPTSATASPSASASASSSASAGPTTSPTPQASISLNPSQQAVAADINKIVLEKGDLTSATLDGLLQTDDQPTFSPTDIPNACGQVLPNASARVATYNLSTSGYAASGPTNVYEGITVYGTPAEALQALTDLTTAIGACTPGEYTNLGSGSNYTIDYTSRTSNSSSVPVTNNFVEQDTSGFVTEGNPMYYDEEVYQADGVYLDDLEVYRNAPLVASDMALATALGTLTGNRMKALVGS